MKGDCDPQRRSAALSIVVPLVLMLAGLFPAGSAKAQTLGMVMDHTSESAIVFNADTDTVLGVVPIPTGDLIAIGDCSITRDQTLGFATNFGNVVTVIDVPGAALAPGPNPNPIPISNIGEDTSISPDGNFLVVANGANGVFPISVVDIATQMQISTINLSGANHNSVDVCSDGSVLATSFDTGTLHRGTIDGGGIITNTGEMLAIPLPNNVSCAPGAQAGVVVSRNGNITSFTIPGLGLVDTRAIGVFGLAAVFNPAGDRVYVRTSVTVEVFTFNSATGALGAGPMLVIPGVPVTDSFFGMEQIGIHPNGTKLYVPTTAGGGGLRVFDPADGSPITTIMDPAIVGPTGVCFPPLPPLGHFLCYKTRRTKGTPKFEPLEVSLADQFEDKDFRVKKPKFLCNPADKNGEGIADEETHLVGYKIERENDDDDDDNGFIQKNVQVDNQFGTIFVDVKRPDRLLVPSSKDLDELLDPPDPEAHNVDHFKCYKVIKTRKRICEDDPTDKCKTDSDCDTGVCNLGFPKNLSVNVKDQFIDKQLKVKKPVRLCVPVDKESEGIKNPDNHLMCYKVTREKKKLKGIHVNNQFGPEQLDTIRAKELCVPSEKTLP